MNIQIVRDKIRDFLVSRVRIDYWGLDYPSDLYATTLSGLYPANSAISLPVQGVIHSRLSTNQVKTEAIFPYRIAYRFPGQLAFHDLPFKGLEGILSYIQLLSIVQTPDSDIQSFTPLKVEDSITVSRVEGDNTDWIVYINIAFEAKFNTTVVPDISDIQSPDYYNFDNPPSIEELNMRIYRAKEKFDTANNSTHILDSEIKIIP
jgi:hypothetical protein